ncbi:ArsA-related P-loop ATPase [Streptomyces sp. SCSIO 30461]|uniref:ArsA family ATPase n=1 Tax=Streptomyces sp. SCSIO 30461 TaxID=3118085 RepID=UPI0030D3596C
MRLVLVTGLGGSGRTTVAAATALAAARSGRRTLLLTAGGASVLGAPVGIEPVDVAERMWAARIDSGAHFRRELLAFQERCTGALDLLGARKLEDEELTELPGSEQFALLKALRELRRGAVWDTVVVDMPPVHETIALLGLPEQLRRYVRRLLPPERQAARALRPVLAQLAGVPMPARWLYESAARWETELSAVQQLIEDTDTTVRLVAEPGPAAEDALLTARLGVALYGMRVDAVVANRILPSASPDPWLAGLRAQQEKALDRWHQESGPGTGTVPLLPVAHLGRDPRGLDDLSALAPALGMGPEPEAADHPEPWDIRRAPSSGVGRGGSGDASEGELHWVLPLPGAVKEELGLVRRGDELLVTVGPFRRVLPLPPVLRRCTVSGAGLRDGELRIRFTPDPAVWPQRR